MAKRRVSRRTKRKDRRGSGSDRPSSLAAKTVTVFRPAVFGFPDRLLTTIRYHSLLTLTSTAGSFASTGLRWNSTYDPDYTNTGHQPLYRDTFAAIYDHYAVVSARAIITVNSATSDVSGIVAAVTDDDSSPTTNVDTFMEQNHGYRRYIGSQNGGSSQAKMNLAWDCKSVLGIDPYASQTYKTAVDSNPSEESLLWIKYSCAGGGTGTVYVDIVMEFDTLWTELSTPTGS